MKQLGILIVAAIFAVTVSAMAGAASIKCTVVSIDQGKVLLDCGSKADRLKVDGKVKVKSVVKKKAIEGC